MSKANLDKKPAEVAAMFDEVAPTYDLTNDLLSLGMTRRWRGLVAKAVDPRRGQFILDCLRKARRYRDRHRLLRRNAD